MFKKGYVSKAQNISDKLSLSRRPSSPSSRRRRKMNVLEKYTKDKTIKELKSEVEKAQSDELAKKATWELEKTKEDEAREADRELQAHRPERRPRRLRQRPEPVRRQQPAADRGRGDGPRAAEDLQPARHHPDAGQHQGPRVDDRPDQARACRPGSGSTPSPTELLNGTVDGRRPPARPDAASSARTSRSTPPTSRSTTALPGLRPGMTAAGRDPGRPSSTTS